MEERELCWYGDAPFLSHLWKVLSAEGFSARIRFGHPHIYDDPRHAAQETHALVTGLRAEDSLVAAAGRA
jgi:hypothetical protein